VESAIVSTDTREMWLERLPVLLEGYEPWDIYSADETVLFYSCLLGRMLTLKGQSCDSRENCQRVDNSDSA
jgi:hypothetical protein